MSYKASFSNILRSVQGVLVDALFNLEGTAKMYLQKQRTLYGGLAQLGERLPCKQEVTGSIPVLSTKRSRNGPIAQLARAHD